MTRRLFFVILAVFMILTSACQPAPAAAPTQLPATATALPEADTPTPEATPLPPTEPAAPVLELVAADGASQALTLADLQALPVTEGQAGFKSSTGKIFSPLPYKGVALKDLVVKLPAFDETMGLSLEASDGYAITYSYDQVMNGSFIQYDPATGDELKTPLAVTAILAYESDGKPLDPKTDGTLRLFIVSDEPKQVTDGHWAVKFITKVEVKLLAADWTLRLEGTTQEDMDRATFESGAAPNCHGKTWTDDKAQEWLGIPLWLLVGRVDDDVKHEGPAFNDALAEAAYTVDVIAADGYTVTFDAARLKRNDNILVAHLVNGNPLPDKYFPLRLVGADLQKNEMAGQVVKIVVHLEGVEVPPTEAPEPSATPAPAAAGGGLSITGLVENELALQEADLREMEVVKITAEHPKKGPQDYEGVRLNALLELAKVKPEAKKLVFTASDGFSAEVFLAEVQACADCLVAFDEGGLFKLVMPGLPSNLWVKDVVKLEVKE